MPVGDQTCGEAKEGFVDVVVSLPSDPESAATGSPTSVRPANKGQERNRPTTTTDEARRGPGGGHRVDPPPAADDPASDSTLPNWVPTADTPTCPLSAQLADSDAVDLGGRD